MFLLNMFNAKGAKSGAQQQKQRGASRAMSKDEEEEEEPQVQRADWSTIILVSTLVLAVGLFAAWYFFFSYLPSMTTGARAAGALGPRSPSPNGPLMQAAASILASTGARSANANQGSAPPGGSGSADSGAAPRTTPVPSAPPQARAPVSAATSPHVSTTAPHAAHGPKRPLSHTPPPPSSPAPAERRGNAATPFIDILHLAGTRVEPAG